uniref:Capsid protein n=1 Tax=Chaetoceros diatodnavirus 1 TaxID=1290581 RepID=CAPSD_CDDV1|nr:RecName: Full=Capsid protein [Chaetoceros setoense DNA virus]
MARKYAKRSKSRPRTARRSPKSRSRPRSRAPRRKAPSRPRIQRVNPVRRPMNSTAAQSLAIYRNPFSHSPGQPKIPDGKAIMSIGSKVQVSAQLLNKASGDDILHVFLYPGLTQGMVVFGDSKEQGTRGFTAYGYNDHMTYDASSVYNAGTGADGNIESNDNINEWRLVSQGLKLSLLNTDEENDGWFECVRYKDALRANEFAFYSGDNLEQTTATVFGPDITFGSTLLTKNLVNSPTYVSGALEDIDKYEFKLQAQSEQHDFKRIPDRWYTEHGVDTVTVSGVNDYVTLQADTAQAHSIHNSLVDDSFDAVYIRIHCRTNSGAGATTGSKLLAHLVSNQELVYDEDQNEHKFMTQAAMAKAEFMKANEMARKSQVGADMIGNVRSGVRSQRRPR